MYWCVFFLSNKSFCFRSHSLESLDSWRRHVPRKPAVLRPHGAELLRHNRPPLRLNDDPLEHHGPTPKLGQSLTGWYINQTWIKLIIHCFVPNKICSSLFRYYFILAQNNDQEFVNVRRELSDNNIKVSMTKPNKRLLLEKW